MNKSYKIDSSSINMRIDRWIRNNIANLPQGLIEKNLRNGKIKLNKKKIKSSTKVKTGDQVDLFNFNFKNIITQKKIKFQPSKEIIKANEDLIIDNNEDFIVLNKSAGISVQGGTKSKKNLVDIFTKSEIFQNTKPFSVHRLDKDTSGCMVVAKSQEALVNLQKQIKEKIASREYIAVIHGAPNSEEGQIVGNIGRDKLNRLKYKVVEETSGRYACTYWKLEERFGNYSLMSFKLDTGRTHQIRVHCAHINHPIVGDPLYGRCKKLPCKLDGQALHAIKLGLIHPINGKEMIFESELPLDFQKLLSVLKVK